ncbi:MAG: hypothetical protein IJH39_01400 [Clostridia bacterium]|nr:hypothetical protein [Clostridia bacterium]
MERKKIKEILMSMRTQENEELVNNILGKLDLMDEDSIQKAITKVGDNEDNIRKFFESKLSERRQNNNDEKFPINGMFTYGISGNCIHLHLPVDLHKQIREEGLSRTIDTVNFYLLDAIDRIQRLKNNGFHRFKGKDSIYMISPALVGKELKTLENLDFTTHLYRKKDLKNKKFVNDSPEASLATKIFGEDKNIGTALISFDIIQTEEWQKKKRDKYKEFEEKGIALEEKIKE